MPKAKLKPASKLKPLPRCGWAESDALFLPYHDDEWGVPVHDDRELFEMLNLEGAQAGLSWLTILKKREGYRRAFDNFDARKLARLTPARQAALMKNEGIVRNRLKIKAVVENAKAYLALRDEGRTLDEFLWAYVDGKPLFTRQRSHAMKVSQSLSKDLKKRGFRFVGPTICFAFMQAVGMINDHSSRCFRFVR